MEGPLRCPLCRSEQTAEALEQHVRRELRYAPWSCLLCPARFLLLHHARRHFAGPFGEHPAFAGDPQLLHRPDEALDRRLAHLLRQARRRQVPKPHACVCGQCRLLCAAREAPAVEQAQSEAADVSGAGAEPAKSDVAEEEEAEEEPSLDAGQLDALEEALDKATASPAAEETDSDASPRPAEETAASDLPPEAGSSEPLSEKAPKVPRARRHKCSLCDMVVEVGQEREHTRSFHLEARPLACALCPFGSKRLREMRAHQSSAHSMELSEESYRELESAAADLGALTRECFGGTRPVSLLHCRKCDKDVPKTGLRAHVAQTHLRTPLHRCRLCGFASARLQPTRLHEHLRRSHHQAPSPLNLTSYVHQLRPRIDLLVDSLFQLQ